MAESQNNNQPESDQAEAFHEIAPCTNDLSPPLSTAMSLLLKITQPNDKVLPVGVVTERSVYSLVKQVTGYVPLGVTVMNDRDVVVEFKPKSRLWEASALLHTLKTWDKYHVEVTCLMSTKPQLVNMVRDRENARKAAAEYER